MGFDGHMGMFVAEEKATKEDFESEPNGDIWTYLMIKEDDFREKYWDEALKLSIKAWKSEENRLLRLMVSN